MPLLIDIYDVSRGRAPCKESILNCIIDMLSWYQLDLSTNVIHEQTAGPVIGLPEILIASETLPSLS